MAQRERSIEQVVAEIKMLAGRTVRTRPEKFRFTAAAYNIIISMTKEDWQEFQRERARDAGSGKG